MKEPRQRDRGAASAPGVGSLVRAPALALVALLAILAANVATAYWHIGGYQFALNVVLALVSVVLIGIFFMELRKEGPLNRLCAAAGFAWLVIFLVLTFGDYVTRVLLPF